MHDLVIKNAIICDGLGSAPAPGNLAVKDGRIAAIDQSVGPGRETINADGLTLAPGIVDAHTHYDAQITWDTMVAPSPQLGVSTVIIGNCGFTIAPCKPEARELTMRNLVRVEGMSLKAMQAGIDWSFETYPQYLDMLESRGIALNVGAFVGHSSVRTYVMGDAAPKRAATKGEVETMRALVAEAMRAGAIGFSTSTSPSHNGDSGDPMPSRLADEAEMRALVGALGDVGRGVFMLTKGGDTTIAFLESLARETGRPVMIAALLHTSTQPDGVFEDLRQISQARARGHELYGQVSCCPLTMEFTLRSPYPFEGIEAWEPAMRATGEEVKTLLGDRSFRDSVKKDLEQTIDVRLFNGEWHKMRVVEVVRPEHQRYEGATLAELAEAENKHPLDWMLDLGLSEDLDTTFTALLKNSDDEAVGRLLLDGSSLVALSDAGAHLTFFCDAGFGLHLLGYWVRERNLMPLEQAIRKLTSQPAAILGIRERGCLVPGAHADLFLFDPGTINRGPNRRVFDLPGGAYRLTTDPIGVHGVWVNGVRVADGTGLCANGETPGQLLRHFEP